MLLDTIDALSTEEDYDHCAAIATEVCDTYEEFCILMECLMLSLYWDVLASWDLV